MKPNVARFFILLLLGVPAMGQEPPALQVAEQALRESLPEIALQKLEVILQGKKTGPAEQERARLLLSEALLARGLHEEALAALAPLEETKNEVRLLRAHIHLAAGQSQLALPIYQSLAAEPKPLLEARLGAAEALEALGRTAEAVLILEAANREGLLGRPARLRLASFHVSLRKEKRARAVLAQIEPADAGEQGWKDYLEGRLLLDDDHHERAMALFEKLIENPEGLSEGLLVAATMGEAEARIRLRGYDEADKPMEGFISRNPESRWLESVFIRLDQIYAKQRNPQERKLQNWITQQPPRCSALARYYLARMQVRERKFEKAAVSLQGFAHFFPTHPLVSSVHLMRADLFFQAGNFPASVRALEAAERQARNQEERAEIQLRTGRVLYEQGQPLLAANAFQTAGKTSPRLRENALFNAGLAALQQQNYDGFLATYRALTASFPSSPLRPELILEQGLVQARNAHPQAPETLDLLLTHFPLSPRQSEARLALAELAYAQGETAAASNYLLAANNSPGSAATAEHADYLAIFLTEADTGTAPREVVEKALEFIRRYPKSALLPEVRMKLGQIHFRAGDFLSAEAQFVTLARENPKSQTAPTPYTEAALFLAGQSATQWLGGDAVRRALDLFREVVEWKGPLELHARQQQAIIQSRLGKEQDAITLYDIILAAKPEPELRYASLAGKGDNLVALGRKNPAQLEAAIAVFDELTRLPEVPASWRNQALYKKARALKQLGRDAEALAAYYDVLEKSGPETREYFWFYKAGFDAAGLFEEKQDWAQATAIYLKMSRLDGPRSAEVKNRLKELRLKHFIWE